MAATKKPVNLESIFAKTEPQPQPKPENPNADLDSGNIRPSGVGLKDGEIKALDQIAEVYGLSRNALLHYAARRLILDYRAGRLDLSELVEIPPARKNRLRLPKA